MPWEFWLVLIVTMFLLVAPSGRAAEWPVWAVVLHCATVLAIFVLLGGYVTLRS